MLTVLRSSLVVLGSFCIFCTVLPLFAFRHWWVRMMDFPRLQLASILVVTLAAYWWSSLGQGSWPQYGFAAAMALALAWQVWQLLPYTPLFRTQAKSATGDEAERFTVVVANVFQHNRGAENLIAQVHAEDPDLLLVLEIDEWWNEQLSVLQDAYPNSLMHPLDNTYGIGLYSRLELLDPKIEHLIKKDVPSIDTRVRLASGRTVQFYGVHPEPPLPSENKRSTERDAELVQVARLARNHPWPVIVAGDMNDVAWSATTRRFQRLSRLLDPRIGRGLFSTFHAKVPVVRWPLDHVFFSTHFRVVEVRLLESFGSDHFPILITLCLEPEERNGHEEIPRMDGEDREEVRSVVYEARADNEV
ncbi:MAG: endonuclease/exonuclease/phosphatase family protein [Nannocystaceae bacterium]